MGVGEEGVGVDSSMFSSLGCVRFRHNIECCGGGQGQ